MELDEIIQYLGEHYNLPPDQEEVEADKEYDLFLFGSRHLGNKLVYLDEPEDVKSSFSGMVGCIDMENSRFYADVTINPRNIVLPKTNQEKTDLGVRIVFMEHALGSMNDVVKARAAGGLGCSVLPFNCYVRKQDNVANYTTFKRQ